MMHVPKILAILALGMTAALAAPASEQVPPGIPMANNVPAEAVPILAALSAAQTAGVSSPPASFDSTSYNYTVINSDCPCDRHKRQYCTLFRRQGVRDGTCHRISRPAISMRVYDEYIAADNHLLCTGFEGSACDGRTSPNLSFPDNTRCIEPTEGVSKAYGWPYRSFRCHHPGWGSTTGPEGTV